MNANVISIMPGQGRTSPVTIIRARPPRADQKDDENDNPEFNAEFAQIEKDLILHRLGTFKVYEDDMTFIWRDETNREIATESQLTGLEESMKWGIYRTDLQNRMSGVITMSVLVGHIFPPNYNEGEGSIELKEVEKFNKEAEYPVIRLDRNMKIEMQSGQHRMEVLKRMKKVAKDRWWIVTMYDSGM